MKKKRWKKQALGLLMAGLLGTGALPAQAAENGLTAVQEEASILPIGDGSGALLLKSDGYYCLKENGTLETTPGVHYMDHLEIGGVVFNGFYYHDETGKFAAGNPHMVTIHRLTLKVGGENYTFDGSYMVNNLGRLSGAAQVRYMDQLVVGNVSYDGYFYFNEYGRMVITPGIYEVHNMSNGREFDGRYYFGGPNGALVTEAGVTPDGFAYNEEGLLEEPSLELPVEGEDLTLEERLETALTYYEGDWSVYYKNLETEESIDINDRSMNSASLIKVFVMAKTYADWDLVLEHEARILNQTVDSPAVAGQVETLLQNMITVSDNEAFNELVRLQSEQHDFLEGAQLINEYLLNEGYHETMVAHTLSPSASPEAGLPNGINATSAMDCGMLLEKIYRRECVSATVSVKMLNLLLEQQTLYKIPAGIPDQVVTASKSGENDMVQSDIAIVFSEKNPYILCVLCNNYKVEDEAIQQIREISKEIYSSINATES